MWLHIRLLMSSWRLISRIFFLSGLWRGCLRWVFLSSLASFSGTGISIKTAFNGDARGGGNPQSLGEGALCALDSDSATAEFLPKFLFDKPSGDRVLFTYL